MLKSPSKFLNRPFLRSLLDNRFLSPRGLEYSEEEVRDLLLEKEQRLAEKDYAREIREQRDNIDHRAIIVAHQERVMQSLIPESMRTNTKTCQVFAPCSKNSVGTDFYLPENSTNDLKQPQQRDQHQTKGPRYVKPVRAQRRGGKMQTYLGYPIIATGNYTKDSIKKDIHHMNQIMNELNRVSRSSLRKSRRLLNKKREV